MEVRNSLDRLLEFRLSNEVGAYFSLTTNEVTGYLVLQLLNKNKQIIDQIELVGISGGEGTNKPITALSIDYNLKQLILTYYDGSTITCDISGLISGSSGDTYSKSEIDELLADKQDKITSTTKINWSLIDGFSYTNLSNKPTIPTKLSDLSDDTTHRTVTDEEKAIWNAKSDFDGNYESLSNKPIIPTVTNDLTNELKEKYDAAYEHSIAEHAPVNAEENRIDSISLNKTALTIDENKNIDIPAKIENGTITIGNNSITPLTSFTETDPTVPSWAKEATKPTYTAEEVGALPNTTVIPTKVSELENDSNFLTSTDIENKLEKANIKAGTNITVETSETTNDVTISATVPTKVSELENDSNFVDSTSLAGQLENKADKASTLAGYGITDVKIENGIITVGENTITPVTDVSGLEADIDSINEVINNLGNTYEVISNKVTSISSTSTDIEYPTAKAVYTQIDTINAALDTKQDTLPDSYIEYLKKQTFQTPTISIFQILNSSGSSVAGTYELGTSVTVSQINHAETNIDNINGSLTFNGTDSIAPTTTITVVDITDVLVSTSKTFYLTGTDIMDGSISKSAAITFYRYAYSNVTSSTTTPTSGTRQSAVSTFASSGASFTYAVGDYIYLYTTNSGKTIQTYVLGQWADVTTESLGTVAFTQNNGTVYNYYVYRTGPFIAAGTATYRV